LATHKDTHLGSDDKGDQRNGNHDVDPHKPAQECKVGGHAGSKVGFDFLDAQLPGDEDGEEAGGLPFPVSPSLGREKKGFMSPRNCRLQVRILIGFPRTNQHPSELT